MVDVVWNPRKGWVVEAYPKDKYYNYGKQILYVDSAVYNIWYKDIYSPSGEYWKIIVASYSYRVNKNETISITGSINDVGYAYDFRSDHATAANDVEYGNRSFHLNLPVEKLGPDYFSEANMRQMSK